MSETFASYVYLEKADDEMILWLVHKVISNALFVCVILYCLCDNEKPTLPAFLSSSPMQHLKIDWLHECPGLSLSPLVQHQYLIHCSVYIF